MRNGSGRKVRFIGVVALAGMALPALGFGYGVEVPENGTVAHGRGGAFVARASDVSAVGLNMAGVMGLPGFQLGLSVNVGASSNCFARQGVYDPASDTVVNANNSRFRSTTGGDPAYFGRPYPEVCSGTALALAANLFATWRVNRWLAFGLGVTTPSTPGSGQVFADDVQLPNGTLPPIPAPTPARNMLFRKNLLVIYPTIGVAVQPHRRLRFGLTLQPSIARFQFGVMANTDFNAPQSPDSDLLIELNAGGFFMAGAVSTQVLVNRFLSFGAQFHYNGPVSASGTANTTAEFYGRTPTRGSFNIDEMAVQLPWNLRAGARFALPRAGRPTQDDGSGRYDPMTDDVFDVEADFSFENTSSLGVTTLRNSGQISAGGALMLPAPKSIVLNSNLSNVYGFRIGGDYNIIPGTLSVRLGASYETQGLSPTSAVVHIPAYAGASIHAGVSFRRGPITINLGFGHFFFQELDASQSRGIIVTAGNSALPGSPQIDPNGCTTTQGQGACTISRGTFHGNLTNGSIGATYRF